MATTTGRRIKTRANGHADSANHTKEGSCRQVSNHPSGFYNHTGPEVSAAGHHLSRTTGWIDTPCHLGA